MGTNEKTARKPSRFDRWLLQKIYQAAGRPALRIMLQNGAEVSPADGSASANIVIQDTETLLRLMLEPEIAFGEAYSTGHIRVEGDLIVTLEILYKSMQRTERGWFAKLISKSLEYSQQNSLGGARRNIHQHYDLGTDFYRLWLDPELVYTCAYFPSPNATLEEAQIAKMDYVCRKLRLQPGEQVVDAGCGWGALALYMAKNYGVNVRAFNISHEQILVARQRAKEMKLGHQVEFIEDDYRNISGKCDAFVSVGMLEHVGRDRYKEFGEVIHKSLSETGRGLLHFIGRNRPTPFSNWTRKRIFPGAYAPALGEVTQIFERWNLSILDVENLRLHYAKTLEHWLTRFESAKQKIAEMFGREFVNAWRLYLAGSVAGFRAGTLQLFQIVFARTACAQLPVTRNHLYTHEQEEERETKWMHATS